ncbi:hypothetical protein PVAND_008569 [Polypedilum vanderplanki]|uniref:mitogen-activated protein kinase kinase n=1 Tax=Polypedilum vanderplanki TaxID=319348 RepID=A0A9J6CBG2_POLVA|nr:hypothetical protein PVAND_008569 [Polypedilum vanderplanki]
MKKKFVKTIMSNLNINLTPVNKKRPIPQLPIPTLSQRPRNQDNEKKLRALRTNTLKINGINYETNIQDLEYLSELGNGTSGHVVKMKHKPSGAVIAVKQMRRTGNDEETKRITMDLDVVLKSHDCPFIVQCLGCFITEADVWICMELMSTCFDKLQKRTQKPIPEYILKCVTEATVNALNYLKIKHGVIHRDVKPSNILIDEHGIIKLCDFGISGRLVDSKAKTRSAGCAAYMAPERIDPKKPEYDIRADVWSLGITLVELATGAYPYKDCKTDFEVLTKVLDSEPPSLPDDQGFSEDFKDFVKRCLTKDYKQRPKYNQLLEHPFLNNPDPQKLVNVSAWFHAVTKEAGIVLPTQDSPNLTASHLNRISSLQSVSVSSTQIQQHQQPLVMAKESSSVTDGNNFSSMNMNPFSPPSSTTSFTSPQFQMNNTIEREMSTTNRNIENIFPCTSNYQQQQQQQAASIYGKINDPINSSDMDYRSGNGYQKLTSNNFNDGNIDYELLSKFNRMHTQSPQLPRKNYALLRNVNSPPYLHEGSQSPLMHPKLQYDDRNNFHYQHSPYKSNVTASAGTYSPVVKKRYGQDGVMVAEDLEFRILHGNTSPIVLQRFYHQQNQLRDQKEEQLRAMKNYNSSSTNPFEQHNFAQSNIPIATHHHHNSPSFMKYTSSSPTPQRNTNFYENNYNNASPSYIPQYTKNTNGNGTYARYQPNINHSNLANRPPIPCPNSPQLDRLRANLEKPNFYERHQLPVEVQLKENVTTSSSGNQSNEKSKGMVKTYIKTRLHIDQNNKDGEKVKSLATISPIRSATNPFAAQSPAANNKTTTNLISSTASFDRHRSPDPPMRTQRGSQSPLILRKKLEMASSPILQRRYMSASPSPPPIVPRMRPTYNNNDLGSSPHHYHARINYTPEPQRRIYQ